MNIFDDQTELLVNAYLCEFCKVAVSTNSEKIVEIWLERLEEREMEIANQVATERQKVLLGRQRFIGRIGTRLRYILKFPDIGDTFLDMMETARRIAQERGKELSEEQAQEAAQMGLTIEDAIRSVFMEILIEAGL